MEHCPRCLLRPLTFISTAMTARSICLLDLIRKQQIDIRDIPIATITSQYLSYLDHAREMDLDIGAEFVFMAATLIHIKSRMLLPVTRRCGKKARRRRIRAKNSSSGCSNTSASKTRPRCFSRSARSKRTSGRIRRSSSSSPTRRSGPRGKPLRSDQSLRRGAGTGEEPARSRGPREEVSVSDMIPQSARCWPPPKTNRFSSFR